MCPRGTNPRLSRDFPWSRAGPRNFITSLVLIIQGMARSALQEAPAESPFAIRLQWQGGPDTLVKVKGVFAGKNETEYTAKWTIKAAVSQAAGVVAPKVSARMASRKSAKYSFETDSVLDEMDEVALPEDISGAVQAAISSLTSHMFRATMTQENMAEGFQGQVQVIVSNAACFG